MRVLTPEQLVARRRYIRHEAAHVIGAIHVRSDVLSIEVRWPYTNGASVEYCGLTDWSDGIMAMCGAIWSYVIEPVQEDHAAVSDIKDAYRCARSAGCAVDDLLCYALDFVTDQKQNILDLAARIDTDLPQSGILRGRRLRKILDDFVPVVPRVTLNELRFWEPPMPAPEYGRPLLRHSNRGGSVRRSASMSSFEFRSTHGRARSTESRRYFRRYDEGASR